jgi:hypothetical protein
MILVRHKCSLVLSIFISNWNDELSGQGCKLIGQDQVLLWRGEQVLGI